MPSSESSNFYPRPPRGGRQATQTARHLHKAFLSTPSARRATHTICHDTCPQYQFLSTPSARRATPADGREGVYRKISIHALREEGDVAVSRRAATMNGFLSTPSARRATMSLVFATMNSIFLSTPSARRATPSGYYRGWFPEIFLSTPSARRATLPDLSFIHLLRGFLSTPSARRATPSPLELTYRALLFLSTPSARRATSQIRVTI